MSPGPTVAGAAAGAGAGAAPALVALALALLAAPSRGAAPRRLRVLVPRAVAAGPPLDGPVPSRRLVPRVLAVATALAVGLLVPAPAGPVLGAVAGAAVGVGLPRLEARRGRRSDPWEEAGAWDQLAACLRSGLALAPAVRAVVPSLAPGPGRALTRVADLVALGADPADAWAPALEEVGTARLARAARRSARSGAAVADVAGAVAADVRAEADDRVAARAERAGVLVTGPLGLCFLPAFLALGIVPVVIGLAAPLLEQR